MLKPAKLPLLTMFIFSAVFSVFGQSSLCSDNVRSVVWNVIKNYDSFSDTWNCEDKLEVHPFNFGRSEAYIVNGLGSGLCGATGNCPTWVVAKFDERPRVILSLGSVIRTVDFKYLRTDKFPELSFRGRMGASDHYFGRFKFDGSKYKLISCVYETYSTDGKRNISKADREYCQ